MQAAATSQRCVSDCVTRATSALSTPLWLPIPMATHNDHKQPSTSHRSRAPQHHDLLSQTHLPHAHSIQCHPTAIECTAAAPIQCHGPEKTLGHSNAQPTRTQCNPSAHCNPPTRQQHASCTPVLCHARQTGPAHELPTTPSALVPPDPSTCTVGPRGKVTGPLVLLKLCRPGFNRYYVLQSRISLFLHKWPTQALPPVPSVPLLKTTNHNPPIFSDHTTHTGPHSQTPNPTPPHPTPQQPLTRCHSSASPAAPAAAPAPAAPPAAPPPPPPPRVSGACSHTPWGAA